MCGIAAVAVVARVAAVVLCKRWLSKVVEEVVHLKRGMLESWKVICWTVRWCEAN